MKLTSSAFEHDGFIPEKYAYKMGSQCNGENYSPLLEWNAVPRGTQSLLLTLVDPDGGNWVHWVLYDIPPDTIVLPQRSMDQRSEPQEAMISGRSVTGVPALLPEFTIIYSPFTRWIPCLG